MNMSNKLYIVMYHYTRDLKHSIYPNIKGLDLSLFEKQLQFFSANFHVIRMEEVINAIDNGTQLPDNAVLLTFDDGYIDNYTVAFPLLKKYRMQGSFFIPAKTFTENIVLNVNKIHFVLASANVNLLTDDVMDMLDNNRRAFDLPSSEDLWNKYAVANRFDNKKTVFCKRILQIAVPERLRNEMCDRLFEKYVGIPEDVFSRQLYMNADQIRVMKDDGMFIGIHGYDHNWMANIPEDKMKSDISIALDAMCDFIDSDKWVMNYPYGNYNERVIDYVKSRGCVFGVTTEVREADINIDNRYTFPRLDCNDFPPKSNDYLMNEAK